MWEQYWDHRLQLSQKSYIQQRELNYWGVCVFITKPPVNSITDND